MTDFNKKLLSVSAGNKPFSMIGFLSIHLFRCINIYSQLKKDKKILNMFFPLLKHDFFFQLAT